MKAIGNIQGYAFKNMIFASVNGAASVIVAEFLALVLRECGTCLGDESQLLSPSLLLF